ncbi:MAG: NAD-dependent epimerase/dehydratase family protein [Phycisphaera sp.]|nr:NAD-dependent epimerase/dehydratase family protein [Phycisphaera sp.]
MKVLVTGGGGFLGGAIVRRLIARGDEVVTLQRGDYAWLREAGAAVVAGDIADFDTARRAAEGCDVVFHVAAKAGVWGALAEYRRINVIGTDSVMRAARDAGVTRVVYTSSPSVTFSGHDERGVNESTPYPHHYLTHYPATKAEAERHVLNANGLDGDERDGVAPMATVSLRPHLIWGPGDNHLVPRIVDRARRGKLKIVGDGANLVDSTYIDNAVDAHLLAADQLMEYGADAACAGKAYFITNGEPVPIRELIDRIIGAAGLPPVRKHVSPGVAYAAGAVLEAVYRLFGIKSEPLMTRFVARQLSTAHWYDISAAKRDLGYEPRVSIDAGMIELREWLSGDRDVYRGGPR